MGWGRPGVHLAAEWLVTLAPRERELDLSGVVVVVPGARVGRHIRSLLLDHATAKRIPFSPPKITTPGGLVDLIAGGTAESAPPASPLARRFAWAAALQSMPEAELQRLVPVLPEESDLFAWLGLGDVFERSAQELAAGMLDFAAVASRLETNPIGADPQRWRAAADVHANFARWLQDRVLSDGQAERARAVQAGNILPTLATVRHIVLAGVPELSTLARSALELVRDRLTCLVFAEDTEIERFDHLGCPIETSWSGACDVLREEQVIFAAAPMDQAVRAMEAIADLNGRLTAEEIVIGVADNQLVDPVERAAMVAGVHVRYAGGKGARSSSPAKLLTAIADMLERRGVAELRALLRHPDIEQWLARRANADGWSEAAAGLHARIDDYAAQSLHGPIKDRWYTDQQDDAAMLERVRSAFDELLLPLNPGEQAGTLPLMQWGGRIREVLTSIYAGVSVGSDADADQTIWAACGHVRNVLEEFSALAGEEDTRHVWPSLTASQALRLAVQQLEGLSIPLEPRSDAVEMLGWLELPMDPAEAVIVVGMNQGCVPPTLRGDPFLNERLRRSLGLAGNRTRHARDNYLLTLLVKSHASVTLIAGRRTAEGDPLWPSRLLLSGDGRTLARRVRQVLGQEPCARVLPPVQPVIAPSEKNGFPIAPRSKTPLVDSMRVTAFRTYLASPYLFYLQHVLNLGECADHGDELDPMAFGTLIHDVLQAFGESPVRHSTELRTVRECLLDSAVDIARKRWGDQPPPCVGLQVEIAKRRLEDVANWQVARTRDGWLIHQRPEWQPTRGNGALVVDGRPMRLRGRIDRIEKHDRDGRLAILDFKTGERPDPPEKVHRGRDGWRDLQLPLYRHLAAELGADDATVLGYVVVPGTNEGVQLHKAEWSPLDLAAADQAAAEVVRRVRNAEFDEVGTVWESGTVFAAICGTDMLLTQDDDAEGGGE